MVEEAIAEVEEQEIKEAVADVKRVVEDQSKKCEAKEIMSEDLRSKETKMLVDIYYGLKNRRVWEGITAKEIELLDELLKDFKQSLKVYDIKLLVYKGDKLQEGIEC